MIMYPALGAADKPDSTCQLSTARRRSWKTSCRLGQRLSQRRDSEVELEDALDGEVADSGVADLGSNREDGREILGRAVLGLA